MKNGQAAKKFEDLAVWQKAHAVVLRVYKLTRGFPKEELFGLAAQMRRAAVSVPANIVEGFYRAGRSDKARFMNVAQSSLEELRYYFILSRDLGYLKAGADSSDLDEIGRMLGAYQRTLRSDQVATPNS